MLTFLSPRQTGKECPPPIPTTHGVEGDDADEEEGPCLHLQPAAAAAGDAANAPTSTTIAILNPFASLRPSLSNLQLYPTLLSTKTKLQPQPNPKTLTQIPSSPS